MGWHGYWFDEVTDADAGKAKLRVGIQADSSLEPEDDFDEVVLNTMDGGTTNTLRENVQERLDLLRPLDEG